MLAILVTANPARGAGARLARVARGAFAALAPSRLSIRRSRGAQFSADHAEEDEEAYEEDEPVPAMPRALDALVTDADVDAFLRELDLAPSALEVAETARVSQGSEEEVASGAPPFADDPDDDEQTSPRRHYDGAEGPRAKWTPVASGDTGGGTTYRLFRRPGPAADGDHRRPLTQFRLEMVMEGVDAKTLARVQMNDVIRGMWDGSLLRADHLARTTEAPGRGAELAFWRMRFPAPLAPREYLFVRKRWVDPDGTYFGVTRDATGAPEAEGLAGSAAVPGGARAFRVRRVFSGQRVRDVRGGRASSGKYEEERRAGGDERGGGGGGGGGVGGVGGGADTDADADAFAFAHTSQASACYSPAHSTNDSRRTRASDFGTRAPRGGGAPAAELVSIYHEDSGVPAAVITLGAMKGLAPYMRSLEEAVRGGKFPEEAGLLARGRRRRMRDDDARRGGGSGARASFAAARRSLFFGKGAAGKLASFWPARRIREGEGGAWDPRGIGASDESAPLGLRHGARRALRRMREGVSRAVRRGVGAAAGHERIHAEGRRRRLVVRAAGLVAVVARMRGGGAGSR